VVTTKASQTALALKADASALQTLSNDVATHATLAYTQVQVDGLLAALPTGASATVQQNIVSGVQTLAEVNTSGDCVIGGDLTSTTVSTTGNIVVGANMIINSSIYLYGTNGVISCASLSQSSPAVGTVLAMKMWSRVELGWTTAPFITNSTPVVMWTVDYYPKSTTSFLSCLLSGHKIRILGAGDDGQYYARIAANGADIGFTDFGHNGARDFGDMHQIIARYTNSSTAAVTLSFYAFRSNNSATMNDDAQFYPENAFFQVIEYSR
jgi:hypothetical protein